MKRLFVISIFVMAILTNSIVMAEFEGWLPVPGTSPQLLVRPGHPRLLVTPDNLSLLRCKAGIAGYESACPQFGALQSMYQDMIVRADSLRTDYRAPYLHHFSALVYLISGDASFCDVPKTQLDTLTSGAVAQAGEFISAAPLSYDWCYPTFSAAQKAQYGNWFVRFAEQYPTLAGSGSGWQAHPRAYNFLYPFAVFGDTEANDPDVGVAIKNYYEQYRDEFVPGTNELSCDGATDGYSSKYVDAMRLAAEAFLIGTNYDSIFSDSSFLSNNAFQWMSRMRPDRANVRFPSKNVNNILDPGAWPQYSLRYDDPYAQGMADYVVDNGLYTVAATNDLTNTVTQEWQLLLWYEPWRASSSLDNLPKVFEGSCSGINLMRSDWDMSPSSQTVIGGFFNSNVDPETHRTQNSFTISRGGDGLLIDAGQRDGDGDYEWGYPQYYIRTVAHNAMLIYDPNEDFGQFVVGGYAPGFAKSNDGGQCCWVSQGSRWPHVPNNGFRGEVTKFEDAASYTYLESDATPSYRSTKTDKVERVFLNLKPDIFVVFDRVNSLNAAFPKRYLMHMVERPLIDGTATTIAGQQSTGGVFESADSSLVTVKYGESALLSKTLLPAARKTRIIGGKNLQGNPVYQTFRSGAPNTWGPSQSYEFYVDGINWPPENDRWVHNYSDNYRYDRNSNPGDEAGDWRVEVEPVVAQNFDTFLTVMQVKAGDLFQDEEEATVQGGWSTANYAHGYGFFKDDAKVIRTGSSTNRHIWTFTIPQSGSYEVFVWLPRKNQVVLDQTALYTVTHAGGPSNVAVNQDQGKADWYSLGTFSFNTGSATVMLSSSTGASMYTIADAVKLVYKDAPLAMVPSTLITSSNNNMQGALIGSDRVVMFSRDGSDITSTAFTVNANGNVNFLLFDAVPNAGYTVSVNGQTVTVTRAGSQYVSSGEGVLLFSASIGGGGLQTCAAQAGDTCTLQEYCPSGSFIPASDTERCCGQQCIACDVVDADCDGTIENGELSSYIATWFTGDISISDVISAIERWKGQ